MKLMKRLAHSATNKKMLRQPSLRSAMTARNCRRTAGCTSAFRRGVRTRAPIQRPPLAPVDSQAENKRRHKKSGLDDWHAMFALSKSSRIRLRVFSATLPRLLLKGLTDRKRTGGRISSRTNKTRHLADSRK